MTILRFLHKQIKPIARYIILAALLGILIFLFVSYQRTWQQDNSAPESPSGYQYARPSQQVKSFSYTGHNGEQKTLSIHSDYLTVNRKKVRGIGIGMIKELTLYNGTIQLYRYPDESALHASALPENPAARHGTFKTIAGKNSPLVSNFSNISAVMIHPVTVEWFTHHQLTTRITAQSASIDLKHQRIEFSGRVQVVSGQRELTLDRLELNPENESLTGMDYTLQTPDGKTSGKQIVTDLYLRKSNE